jgi:hypothetical protein
MVRGRYTIIGMSLDLVWRAAPTLGLEPPELVFPVLSAGEGSSITLRLTNTHGEVPVAFKLRTTKPKLFTVRHGEGSLGPGEAAEVRITLKAMKDPAELLLGGAVKFQVRE